MAAAILLLGARIPLPGAEGALLILALRRSLVRNLHSSA
jgi:hypothetical protein